MNPVALTIEQVARMLAVPEEKVRDHVAAGAPVGADGTVNLVNYAAWLNRQLAGSDGD
jgi:plasmid maintenance system antidote protein VapI